MFDRAAAEELEASSRDFASLPSISTGERTNPDTINRSYQLLEVRFAALKDELNDIRSRVLRWLDILDNEEELLNQTLAVAEGEAWVQLQPLISGAELFHWDFSAGHGLIDTTLSLTDPSTGLVHDESLPRVHFDVSSDLGGGRRVGLGTVSEVREVPPKNLVWSYVTSGNKEELYGTDWAQLSVLEDRPKVSFGPPAVFVELPIGSTVDGVFEVSGSVPGGVVPVLVRISFVPRRRKIDLQGASGTIALSPYRVPPLEVTVYDADQVYLVDQDYSIDDDGFLGILAPLDGVDISVVFTEYFPAYECSINGKDWSPITMLDPTRLYPDSEKLFPPVEIEAGRFPLTDETGRPIGLFLRMVGQPTSEMLFRVSVAGGSNYGATATLEVELERPIFLNAMSLSPFTDFPMQLKRVEAESFTSDSRVTLFDSSVVIDRPTVLRFPRQTVRRFFLTFFQENYSWKQHFVEPSDKLRRDILNSVQSVLPASVQRTERSVPTVVNGAQYDFAVESLSGEDWSISLPGVVIVGPYVVDGMPELIRPDWEAQDTVDAYLHYRALDANGTLVDTNELLLVSGDSFVYPSVVAAARVEFYLKFVLRDPLSVVRRFLLQVKTV